VFTVDIESSWARGNKFFRVKKSDAEQVSFSVSLVAFSHLVILCSVHLSFVARSGEHDGLGATCFNYLIFTVTKLSPAAQ
jgi:hypothetical protein